MKHEFDNLGRGPNDELPADPENRNDERASWAESALAAFQAATGVDDSSAVCDLLADLMHLCDRQPDRFGTSFHRQLERAAFHYEEETTPIDEDICTACERDSLDCSHDPCAAVIADRAA